MLILPLVYLSIHFSPSLAPSPCPSGHSCILLEDTDSLVIALPVSYFPTQPSTPPHKTLTPHCLPDQVRSHGDGFSIPVYPFTTLIFCGSHSHSARSKYTGAKSESTEQSLKLSFQDTYIQVSEPWLWKSHPLVTAKVACDYPWSCGSGL